MGKVIKFEDHVCRLRLPEGEEDAIISYIRKKTAKSGISEEEYLTLPRVSGALVRAGGPV